MRTCADRLSEELLLTTGAWKMIMAEILYHCKPYLDVEADVVDFFLPPILVMMYLLGPGEDTETAPPAAAAATISVTSVSPGYSALKTSV